MHRVDRTQQHDHTTPDQTPGTDLAPELGAQPNAALGQSAELQGHAQQSPQAAATGQALEVQGQGGHGTETPGPGDGPAAAETPAADSSADPAAALSDAGGSEDAPVGPGGEAPGAPKAGGGAAGEGPGPAKAGAAQGPQAAIQADAAPAPAVAIAPAPPTKAAAPGLKAPGNAGPQVVREAVAQVHAIATTERAGIEAARDIQLEAVRTSGEQQKQSIGAAIATLRTDIEASMQALRGSVSSKGDTAKATLAAARDREQARIQEATGEQVARIVDGAAERRSNMLIFGDEKAGAALEHAEAEAIRLEAGAAQRAEEAHAVGEAKVKQFASADEASDIASMAREVAAKTGSEFKTQASTVAGQIRSDGQALADAITADAVEAADAFVVDDAAIADVRKAGTDAQADLANAGTEVIAEIDNMVASSLEQVDANEAAALAQVDTLETGYAEAIDAAIATAQAGITDGATDALTALDDAMAEINTLAAAAEPEAADATAQGILSYGAQLTNGSATAIEGLNALGTGALEKFTQTGKEGADAVRASFKELQEANKQLEDGLTEKLDQAVGEQDAAMVKVADEAIGQLTATADEVVSKYDEVQADGEKQITEKLSKGSAEMTAKADGALEKMDERLTKLGPELTAKGDEIENASLWDSIVNALGSFFKGFFSQLWGFIKGLLLVLLVIAIILVVALVIAAILLYAAPGLLLAIVGFLVAYGATILAVIGYIGLAVGIAVALYSIYKTYKVWQDPNMSWAEKWEATGRTVFDIVDAIGIEKFLKPFKLLFKGAKAADTANDLSHMDDLNKVAPNGTGGASHIDDVAKVDPPSTGTAHAAGAVDEVPSSRWWDEKLTPEEMQVIYKAETKNPKLDLDGIKSKMDDGLRFDPNKKRWVNTQKRLDEIANAKVAPKGPSGKRWDDPDLSLKEFKADYHAANPTGKLDDAALKTAYESGKRINPATGRIKKPALLNDEIRVWYNKETGRIAAANDEWIKAGLSLEERAKKAYDIRHGARIKARQLMGNKFEVDALRARDMKKYGNPDGPTFEQLIAKAMKKGKTRQEALDDLIGSSQRTSAEYNAKFGVNKGDNAAPATGTNTGANAAAHADGAHGSGHGDHGGHQHSPAEVAWHAIEAPVKVNHASHEFGGHHGDEHGSDHADDHGTDDGHAADGEHADEHEADEHHDDTKKEHH
jgi:ABC-type multidrug transport system fused ATPase/permease subunit